MRYDIYPSDHKAKKFVVTDGHRKIYFGAAGYSDYTIHKDPERKNLYDDRHHRKEHWRNPNTAGFWAKWILWNKPTIRSSIADTKKRFNIDIVLHRK